MTEGMEEHYLDESGCVFLCHGGHEADNTYTIENEENEEEKQWV